VVAEAGGTAGLAWDERNRVRRDTAPGAIRESPLASPR